MNDAILLDLFYSNPVFIIVSVLGLPILGAYLLWYGKRKKIEVAQGWGKLLLLLGGLVILIHVFTRLAWLTVFR
ncbi:MAG: hypothetical protein R3B38_00285 [Patescibacteria group bacterium]